MSPLLHAFIPGSGCTLLEEALNDTLSDDVSIERYLRNYHEFLLDGDDERAVTELKQCFLQQDSETVDNVHVMLVISISSLSVLNPLDRDKQPLHLSLIMPEQGLTMFYFPDFHCW